MITATEYLPLPDPLLSPWRCASSSAFTRHIPPLLETLETLFLPATPELCAKPLLFTPDVASQFGANVRGLLLAATTAVQSQRSLVFGGGWTYLEHELCPSGHLDCYFHPPFSCPAEGAQDYARPTAAEGWQPPIREFMIGKARVFSLQEAPLQFKPRGVFWWIAHLAHFILRPNRRLEQLVRASRNAVAFRHPILGLHARQGDACRSGTGRVCFAPADYLAAVEKMVVRYNVTAVFIATDSPDLVAELRSLAPHLDFLHLGESTHSTELKGTLPPVINPILRTRMGLLDRRVVAESSLVDMFLLAECDFLIGQFSSAFSLLALELSAAEKGFVPPYIGLDGPWQSLVN